MKNKFSFFCASTKSMYIHKLTKKEFLDCRQKTSTRRRWTSKKGTMFCQPYIVHWRRKWPIWKLLEEKQVVFISERKCIRSSRILAWSFIARSLERTSEIRNINEAMNQRASSLRHEIITAASIEMSWQRAYGLVSCPLRRIKRRPCLPELTVIWQIRCLAYLKSPSISWEAHEN